jgi:glycerol-3-phosphate dehydrogenase
MLDLQYFNNSNNCTMMSLPPPPREEMIKKLKDQKESFDLLVVGGGITGAGILRDATLRGLDVCLIDKGDFASGTSSQSSKLLHGGLRYLQNKEFGLVREASLERKINLEMAPHLSQVYRFVLPIYKWSNFSRIMLRFGLIAYDILAWPKSIGKHKNLNAKKIVEMYPFLKNEELVGGAYYHDVRTDDSRLTLLNIQSGTAGESIALNYFEATKWERTDKGILVHLKDVESGEIYEVYTKILINAGGPWSEIVENLGIDFDGATKLKRTRGSHITITPRFNDFAVLILNEDGRPVFLVPWKEFTVVGTTDDEYTDKNEEVKATKEDVDYLIGALNKLFPENKITYKDVHSSWAGIRPLVYQEGKDERRTSRDHTIYDYGDVISIVGGKLTTYRDMAKQIVDITVKNLEMNPREAKCVTARLPLWSGEYLDFKEFKIYNNRLMQKKYNFNETIVEMLIQHYGNSLLILYKILDEDNSLTEPLEPELPFIKAQVIFAARYEYARNLIDLYRRRILFAFCKGNGLASIEIASQLMAKELKWSEEKRIKEVENYKNFVKEYIKPDYLNSEH